MEWLRAFLDARDAQGCFCYPRHEVRRLLAVLLLEVGFDAHELTPAAAVILRELAVRAEVPDGAGPAATREAIQRHLAQHPIDPRLLADLRRASRDAAVTEGSPPALQSSIMKYLASEPAAGTRREAVPEGTLRGGPLGFFLARAVLGSSEER